MRPYDKDDFQYNGTIDIETSTVIPQIKNKAGALSDGWFKFGDIGTAGIQLFSDDLSDAVTWTLQISLDGSVWATAKNESGDDITGTIVADTGVIEPLHCVGNMYFRVSLTVVAQTGTIAYKIKTGDNK